MLCDNEGFRKHMIDYLNNIIIKTIEQYKSISKMKHVNDEIQHIHLCTTRPPDTSINIFNKLFRNDVCNLINVCNQHVDALKKLCRYSFP